MGWYPNADGKQQWWDGNAWGQLKPDSLPPLVVWALVLGIVGLAICLIPYVIFFGFWVAAAGLVLGIIAVVKHYRGRTQAIVAVVAAGLAIVLGSTITGAVAGTLGTHSTASSLGGSSDNSGNAPDDTPTESPKLTPTPTPTGPVLTVSQQQAVNAAKGYLQNIGGFSYQGLIDQLDSPYGNGFSAADATIAVNSLNVDYNAQAVQAAQSYMQNIGGFSHKSLVQQLSSPYGSKFTVAQAEYAATQVGL
jgi:hypothetical protein